MCRNVICSAQPAVRNLPCAICRAQPRFRFASSRSRASPYRSLREPSAGSKLPSEGSRKSRHGSLPTRKKTPFTLTCKGRMSRGTTFSCKALLRISFFCNGKSRNHLLTWKHPTLISLSDLLCRVFSTHSFCFRFSDSVQKLPSAPALPNDLSAGGSSSLTAPGAYSSFSSLFSYLLS